MELEKGERLDRYVIDDLLGAGGMGRVYRAHDTVLGRRVALKVLVRRESAPAGGLAAGVAPPTDDREGSEGAARLMREARAAAALDHPNVVSIFDVGIAAGTPYIAMELVNGESLRAFIGKSDVPLDERVGWLVDVARALAAAHARGLVHRDVKPENVMIRDDGVVKVLDFGIAKRRSSQALADSDTEGPALPITGQGVAMGTPLYMAPEQLRQQPLDGRCDQFAWGVVAYELLSGTLPWGSTDAVRLVSDILSIEPAPLDEIVRDVPANVAATIRRALTKDVDGRFDSMDEIVRALTSTTSSPLSSTVSARRNESLVETSPFEPTIPGLPVPPPRASTSTSAMRRLPWLLAAGLLMVVGVLVVPSALRREAPATRASPPVVASLASSSSTRLVDAPIPPSKSPEAMNAFAAAMRAMAESNASAMRDSLERAKTLDPDYASAHLRLASIYLSFRQDAKGREELAEAARLRASLAPYELALLEVLQASVERSPPDFDKVLALARTAAEERFPQSAELALVEASMLLEAGRVGEVGAAATRALSLDPTMAEAWSLRGSAAEGVGDQETALAAFVECLRLSPLSSTCAYYRMALLDRQGRCAELEDAARAHIATAPRSPTGYAMLAGALAAEGRPLAAVEQILEQHWDRISPAMREIDRTQERAGLDILRGDFASARVDAARFAKALGSEGSRGEHAQATQLAVSVLVETGKLKAAVPVVDAFLARREAYAPGAWRTSAPILSDAMMTLLTAKRLAGAMTAAEFHAERDAWIAKWKARAPELFAHTLWSYGHLAGVVDEADAKDALAARAAFEPVRLEGVDENGWLGHALLLAGRIEEAVATLRVATRACSVLGYPMEHLHAQAWLGEALESTGIESDKKDACAAYAVVLRRWGATASVTASRVRKRSRALACE
jgi:serine/threonine protein kinase